MTKGITGKEPNPREVYADIIDLPHPRSRKHPPMSLYDRAAQFAPFAALSGYEDMIDEEARITDEKIELGEDALARLNEQLAKISDEIREGRTPECEITWFVPDPTKAGGRYVTFTESIKRIDPVAGQLILTRTSGYAESNMTIDMKQILEIVR